MPDPALEDRHQRALLELIAHLAQTDEQRQRAPRVLSPVEDLPETLLLRHQLAGLAYKNAGYESLRDHYLRNALATEMRAKLLADCIGTLASAEIPVILLKGVSYIGVIYDDPALRPMADIDLLVKPADHPRAIAALSAIGLRPVVDSVQSAKTHHAHTLIGRGDYPVDLHRSIIQPLRSHIDIAALWDRALPAIDRDDAALRLDPVDEAVLHLVHAARHELMVPALAYLEAHALVHRRRGVDLARVTQRAQQFRLGRAVAAALAMTDTLVAASANVTWPDRACTILPSVAELLTAQPVPRRRQLVRKAALVQGPRELAGLLAVAAYERWRR